MIPAINLTNASNICVFAPKEVLKKSSTTATTIKSCSSLYAGIYTCDDITTPLQTSVFTFQNNEEKLYKEHSTDVMTS